MLILHTHELPKNFIPSGFTAYFFYVLVSPVHSTRPPILTHIGLFIPIIFPDDYIPLKTSSCIFFYFFYGLIFLESNYICQHCVFTHLHIIFLYSQSILSMRKPKNLFKLMTRLCALFMNSITASQSQTHSNVIKTTSDIGRLKIKDMVLFL